MSRSKGAQGILQNPAVERSILGAIPLEGAWLEDVNAVIETDDLFVPVHRRIFTVMGRLAAKGQPLDLRTVCHALNGDTGLSAASGAGYVARLADGLHRKAPVIHWARIVRDNSVLRSVASAGEYVTQAENTMPAPERQ